MGYLDGPERRSDPREMRACCAVRWFWWHFIFASGPWGRLITLRPRFSSKRCPASLFAAATMDACLAMLVAVVMVMMVVGVIAVFIRVRGAGACGMTDLCGCRGRYLTCAGAGVWVRVRLVVGRSHHVRNAARQVRSTRACTRARARALPRALSCCQPPLCSAFLLAIRRHSTWERARPLS